MEARKVTIDGEIFVPQSCANRYITSITEKLVDAIARGRQVEIYYTDKSGQESIRMIEPHTFMWINELMISAWCHKAKSFRSFLVESINQTYNTMAPFTKKEENL